MRLHLSWNHSAPNNNRLSDVKTATRFRRRSCGRYVFKRLWLLAIPLLFTTSAYSGEYQFEKSKFSPGEVCEDMVGTWFTDVIIQEPNVGEIRHITKLERRLDGSAVLKGITFHRDGSAPGRWSFPSEWSCDREWYVEKNEWGYTAFRISDITAQEILLLDEQNNLSAGKKSFIRERPILQLSNGKEDQIAREYFEM
jgi:hypothetical protein